MSQRLTRKEIKHDIREDEVQHVLQRVFQALLERPKLIVGGIVGFLALAVAVAGLLAYLDSRAASASEELAEAIKIAGAPIEPAGDVAGDADAPVFASEEARRAGIRKAAEAVRGGVAGDVANLYLADVAASEGDAETARRIWRAFLDDHDDHVLALSVRLNLIRLDREDGRAEEVADALQRELDGAEKTLPEDVLLYELARTREALGQDAEAADAYQRILDEHPRSPYAAEARQRTASS